MDDAVAVERARCAAVARSFVCSDTDWDTGLWNQVAERIALAIECPEFATPTLRAETLPAFDNSRGPLGVVTNGGHSPNGFITPSGTD